MFVNVIVIDIVSPAKHEDWEGVTTTRIGESTSLDIMSYNQRARVSAKYREIVRVHATRGREG